MFKGEEPVASIAALHSQLNKGVSEWADDTCILILTSSVTREQAAVLSALATHIPVRARIAGYEYLDG